MGYGCLRLDLDAADGEQIAPGFSGAGLWSPTHQAVVGIVTQHGPDGGGRAVTLAQVALHLPEAVFTTAGSTPEGPRDHAAPSVAEQTGPAAVTLPPMGSLIGAVPAQPHPWVDRTDLLTQLDDAFAGPGQHVVSLVGPGGIGKSQLAGAFARRLAADRRAVVAWVGAETAGGLREDYADLGRRLGLEAQDSAALAAKTRAALAATSSAVLLVLDNADNLGLVEPYIPAGGQCSVLITTRDRDTGLSNLGTVVEVPGFDRSISIDLLTSRGGVSSKDANDLAAAVGDLPLAVALALDAFGTRLSRDSGRHTAVTIGDILIGNTITADRGGIAAGQLTGGATTGGPSAAAPDRPGTPGPDAVEGITLAAVGTAVEAISGAGDVLTTLAVLSRDGVSRELLVHILGAASTTVAEDLLDAGLLAQSQEGYLSMHRRTRQALRRAYADASDESLVRAARRLDPLVADRDGSPRLTDTDHETVRHTRELVAALDGDASTDAAVAIGVLANHVLRLLRLAGSYIDLVPLADTVTAALERVLGPDHPDTLASRGNLAVGYWAVGRHDEAITLHEATLTARERVLGPDHPDTLTSRGHLAAGYWAVGRYDEAITLHEATLAARERVLGPDHPDTLTSRGHLAAGTTTRWAATTRRSPCGRRTLTARERVLGPDHPDTLASRGGLAVGYRAVGRHDEAITLDEATLTARERVLGPDHPDTLHSRGNLAVGYQAVGRHDEAITLDEATLTARERVLGPDHPDTLHSRGNLAAGYQAVGRHDEAITLDEATLTARERVLGPDHPHTLTSRCNLAAGYRAVGRHDEADALVRRRTDGYG